MAIIKKYSPRLYLDKFKTFIVDRDSNSQYFKISEFEETFTGGKNGFLIQGSEFLKETTEVKIEIVDVEGNTIYFEPTGGDPQYYEGISKLVSVYVYEDTPVGIAQITILGELKSYIDDNGISQKIPDEWSGAYNVKWQKNFFVDKNLTNKTPVRFIRKPTIDITELSKPIFDKTIPTVTQTGTVQGISETPEAGIDYRTWTIASEYKLKITDDSNWTGSIKDNTISIPDLGLIANVNEVINNKEILIDVPYTSSNIVSDFDSVGYTVSFSHTEEETVNISNLTGSFAKIKIDNLDTYTGDVARVKVFRKSKNEPGDYQFIQEYKLESNELLLDLTSDVNNQVSYGTFNESNLNTYWVSSSTDHPITINYDILHSSVKVDYDNGVGGSQLLYTSESFSFNSGLQYTLSFKSILSGPLDAESTVYTYLSSSDFTQSITNISGSDIFKTRQLIDETFISQNSGSAKLVFDITGDDWYISDVSLRAAQETSFSPDEFILIQDVPRKLNIETFDFKFEFYDVNNNYIPIEVLSSKQFSAGNTSLESISTGSQGADGVPGQDGTDASPFYLIQPLSGSQIKNSTGSLEFQVQRIDSTGSTDISGGAIVLYNEDDTILDSISRAGVSDGGNTINFNPIITNEFITGSKILKLKDSGSNQLYDTIALVDVTDGLGGGSFLTSNLKTNRSGAVNVYNPEPIIPTASFYDVNGTEYRKSVRLNFRYISGFDEMRWSSETGDSEISLAINDGDGGSMSDSVWAATKDVVIVATFTDPQTTNTSTITETFYIVSDGVDGADGSDGVDSKIVNLFADSYVIAYDADGLNPNPSTINLIASSSNFTTSWFLFESSSGDIFLEPEDNGTFSVGETSAGDTASFTAPSYGDGLPFQLTVRTSEGNQTEIAKDTITIARLKPGADSSPFYYIQPLSGSQIKNSTGSLELQVQRLDSTGSTDISGGAIVLYNDDDTLMDAGDEGVTSGSNGVTFNPIITQNFITGSKVITLKDSGSNKIYDTITLLDVTDGLGGGSFISPNLKSSRNKNNSFEPSALQATASFFDIDGNEYSESVDIQLQFNGSTDEMKWTQGIDDTNISLSINDGDGTTMNENTFYPTKDTVIVATFTDPRTSQTNTITETFYIVSDGADGVDALTIVNTNQAHTFPADSNGNVTDFKSSKTDFYLYEGTNLLNYTESFEGIYSGSWNIYSHSISTGSYPTDFVTGSFKSASLNDGWYASGSDHTVFASNIDNMVVTYFITGSRISGSDFNLQTTQTFGKSKTGNDGADGTAGPVGPGVVYRGVYDASTIYYHTSTRRDVVEGSDGQYYLTNNEGDSGTFNWDDPVSPGADWESFSATFDSVATDILFSQDVYADRTINIGSVTGSAVIALVSDVAGGHSNPYISIGQGNLQAYRSGGIYLGYHDNQPVFSMVTGSSELSFRSLNGTGSLTVRGNISASNIAGSSIQGGSLSIGNITGSFFSVDGDGNLIARDAIISGTLEGTAGNIGSWQIENPDDGGSLIASQSNYIIELDPSLPQVSFVSASEQVIKINPISLSDPNGADVYVNDMYTASFTSANITSSLKTTGPYESGSELLYSNEITLDAGIYFVSGAMNPTSINAPTRLSGLANITKGTTTFPNYDGTFGGQLHPSLLENQPSYFFLTWYFEASGSNGEGVSRVELDSWTNTGDFERLDYYEWDGVDTWTLNNGIPQNGNTETGERSGQSHPEFSLTIPASGDYRFRYVARGTIWSGYSIDTSANGSTTKNYDSLDENYTVSLNSTSYPSSSEAKIAVTSKLVEIGAQGIQIITDSATDEYIRMERYPSDDGATLDKLLFFIGSGSAKMDQVSVNNLEVSGSITIQNINSNLVPALDDTYELGSSGSRYFVNLWLEGDNYTANSLSGTANATSTGYLKLPNNMLLAYGYRNLSGTPDTVSYGVSFDSAPYVTVAQMRSTTAGTSMTITSIGTSTFSCNFPNDDDDIMWMAIGRDTTFS